MKNWKILVKVAHGYINKEFNLRENNELQWQKKSLPKLLQTYRVKTTKIPQIYEQLLGLNIWMWALKLDSNEGLLHFALPTVGRNFEQTAKHLSSPLHLTATGEEKITQFPKELNTGQKTLREPSVYHTVWKRSFTYIFFHIHGAFCAFFVFFCTKVLLG